MKWLQCNANEEKFIMFLLIFDRAVVHEDDVYLNGVYQHWGLFSCYLLAKVKSIS